MSAASGAGAPGTTGGGGPEVTVRLAAELTPAELEQWRELEAATVSANPFLVPEWVLSWYDHFVPDPADRLVFLVREPSAGQLLGVAPLYRQELRVGPLRVARRLAPVGAGQVTLYELPGYLAAPGRHREVARAVVLATLDTGVDWNLVCTAPDQSWFEPEHVMAGVTRQGQVDFWQELSSRACVVLRLQPTWWEPDEQGEAGPADG